MLEDLAEKFLDDFDTTHERTAVEGYGHYFLGSVIISYKNAQKFVVDGQQAFHQSLIIAMWQQHWQQPEPDSRKRGETLEHKLPINKRFIEQPGTSVDGLLPTRNEQVSGSSPLVGSLCCR